ncbi:MAG TPA: helix-turn-helix domain-containing protein [Acetobacteraceae bacterium]|nr:helix-turn-helix domain-containing protein [Acetobacteraceae bacterium]
MTTKSLRDLRGEMRSVARGERAPAPLPASAMLSTLSSPGNLDLLRIINQERPASVSGLAERTGRAQSNVSRSLQVLARYGLIRLERDGKEVRPVPLAHAVDVDLTAGTCRTLASPTARRRQTVRVVGDSQ